jgi:hypothetical protein
MAILLALPTELLTLVYKNLDSIDDVHHLALACKATYLAINPSSTYRGVMKRIICTSHQHKFDIVLCYLLELRKKIVHYFQSGGKRNLIGTGPGDTHHTIAMALRDGFREFALKDDPMSPYTEISDSYLDEILARWQGLRVLQSLWLERELVDDDYLVPDHTRRRPAFAAAYKALHARGWGYENELVKSGRETHCLDGRGFNAEQKIRFHAAVTRIWTLNEIRWIFTNFDFGATNQPSPQQAYFWSFLCLCNAFFRNYGGVPVLDRLEEYSLHTFLYHHLFPTHSRSLANQSSSRLPLTFPDSCLDSPGNPTMLLEFCLITASTYLQPPDIIDLVVRCKLKHRRIISHAYFPISTHNNILPCPDYQYPANLSLEDPASHAPLMIILNRHRRAMISAARAQPLLFQPLNPGLWLPRPDPDYLVPVFHQRILTEFDLYARPGRPDLALCFYENWKISARWGIWWWASSEEKARMKLERWREERMAG